MSESSRQKAPGTVIRSGSAFGVKSTFYVGESKDGWNDQLSDATLIGAQGTASLSYIHIFNNLSQMKKQCVSADISVVGIDSNPNVKEELNITTAAKLDSNLAILLRNDYIQLDGDQLQVCNFLFRVKNGSKCKVEMDAHHLLSVILFEVTAKMAFEGVRENNIFQNQNGLWNTQKFYQTNRYIRRHKARLANFDNFAEQVDLDEESYQ